MQDRKLDIPTYYLYGEDEDGTYDAHLRLDGDGEWCHIDDVTGEINQREAELTRLRAENERLRKVADLARMYRELGQQIINGGVWGFDEDVRDKYLHTRHVLDRALAALDQERKEGE